MNVHAPLFDPIDPPARVSAFERLGRIVYDAILLDLPPDDSPLALGPITECPRPVPGLEVGLAGGLVCVSHTGGSVSLRLVQGTTRKLQSPGGTCRLLVPLRADPSISYYEIEGVRSSAGHPPEYRSGRAGSTGGGSARRWWPAPSGHRLLSGQRRRRLAYST